jgi:hypothetical protein
MSSVQPAVSDLLVTVKSRELQRGMLAEKSGKAEEARQHFLAAAHLELVLANDYEQAGESELGRRSRISAASCFWRGGEPDRAQSIFRALAEVDPTRSNEVREIIDELEAESSC